MGGPSRAFWAWLTLTVAAAVAGLFAFRAYGDAGLLVTDAGYLVALVAVTPWVGPR